MKIKIDKNDNVIYRRGWKTLVTNADAKVDENLFKTEASFKQTIHLLFSSKAFMNSATIIFILSILIFFISVGVREFRIYTGVVMKVSSFAILLFISVMLYRSHFWRKRDKRG